MSFCQGLEPVGSLHIYYLPLFCLLIQSFLLFWLSVGKLVTKPCRWHLHFAAFKSQVQGTQLSLTQRFKDVSERAIPRRLMVHGWALALLANWRWSVEKQKLYQGLIIGVEHRKCFEAVNNFVSLLCILPNKTLFAKSQKKAMQVHSWHMSNHCG